MTLQKNKIKFDFNKDKGFTWWYKKCNRSLEGKKKWNKTQQKPQSKTSNKKNQIQTKKTKQKKPHNTTPREGKKLK